MEQLLMHKDTGPIHLVLMNNSVPFRGTSGPHKKHHPFKKGLTFASLEGSVGVSPFMGIKQAESLRKQSCK